MQIVIINDNAQINGGAAKIAILNARDLADAGHQVHFLCAVLPVGRELRDHPRIHIVCSEQFEILDDPHRLRAFVQGWWNIKAARMADALFGSLNPAETVVHLHLWAKALSSSVVRAATRAGFPVVCTLHDFLLACPTGTLFQHPQQRICHLKPMSAACVACNCDTRSYGQKLWRVGRQMVQQHLGHLPGGVREYIAHSELVTETMRPYLPEDATIHRIPVLIESERRPPANPQKSESLVYVGRLVREKGVEMLARAARAESLDLTFVGSGPLAEEIAVANPQAKITGWVDQAASVAQVRAARALVFPSLWYETLGLVVLEAASHGVPSIVPDGSAAAEVVAHGITGLHFRQGDEDDLRSQMRRLRDPAFAAQLGRAAYERFWAAGYASRTAHVQSLEAVYRATVDRREAGGHRANALVSEGTA